MEENFRSNAKIVEAADKFIQKNTLRHEKHMRAAREAGADIREISLKSRKAQYVYLMKAAQECTTGMAGMSGSEEHRGRADASVTETAVLYRDNECAIPLIDLLERKNIPYRMRNADLSFFYPPDGSGCTEYHPVCNGSKRYGTVHADLLPAEIVL